MKGRERERGRRDVVGFCISACVQPDFESQRVKERGKERERERETEKRERERERKERERERKKRERRL
jgi:hypothetical protein